MKHWKVFGVCIVAAFIIVVGLYQNKNVKQITPPRELVIVSYGGAYQEAQRKAFFEPFGKKYNVVIKEETWSGELAKLKEMVTSGNVTWDVVDAESALGETGSKEQLYEKLDYSHIPKDEILPEAIHDYGIGTVFWATIMAYNTDNSSTTKGLPASWKDFWDAQKYPGPRALRRSPVANLEFALIADGVDKDRLYPLDVNRAFKSLDLVAPNVTVWWEGGEQPVQLLSSGEVVFSTAWNGRIANARRDGKPVKEIWEQALLDQDWWVIPKGTKNKDLAMEFIAFASQAEQQVEVAKAIPYGPVNKKALDLLPQDVLANLPTAPANKDKVIFINSQWWQENFENVEKRWNSWLLK